MNSSSECGCCNAKTKILAVILDLDGTLLDTERVTKGVLNEFLAKYGKEVDIERENSKRLGMTQKDSAAAIVMDYDLPLTPDQFIEQITPMYREKWVKAKALPGANRLINHLHKHGVPFALASNSLREYIDAKISHQQGWKECFLVILGSDQVKSGKPAPDLFIEAARRMDVDAAHCLVIEDSLVGVKAAKAAKMKVIAVPAQSESDSSIIADTVLHSLLEFAPELWGLPPFEDWVDNALPIELIHLSVLYKSGTVSELIEEETSSLPDQVCGVYLGWAEVGMDKTCKVVVAIGWDERSCNTRRKIHICVIDENNGHLSDQQMHILLVGYIRGLKSKVKGNTWMDMEILEEDKSIASTALDLPMFIHHEWCTIHPTGAT
ncbi:Flavokinase domain-containing protein/HAD_2 domain-containing protein [Cephalotus follicularis]|uniref:riboflavin kinase n=1 Tax=Cephalotus follicularis TaxID=3775 RepID=A0A1Q3AWQ9_CEPFO|nr:Flavokinase domain-containing protein/HAD_2 domain-containing protein [Cephalotus follicularis]